MRRDSEEIKKTLNHLYLKTKTPIPTEKVKKQFPIAATRIQARKSIAIFEYTR